MHGKPQQKAWRQTHIVDKRQLQSFAKDLPKLFPFNATVHPHSEKLSKMLSEHEHSQLKINKQQTTTFKQLTDVAHDVEGLRNVLKFYDQSNQYLVKVQHSSQNILGKLEQFRAKMGAAYQTLADQEEDLERELELLDGRVEAIARGEDVFDQKENIKNNNKDVKIWERKVQSAKGGRPQQSRVKNDPEEDRVVILEQKMKERLRGVENIEKAILSLGKNLGWPEQDHSDFLKIWNRNSTKNYFQIEEDMQGYFSFYTVEQIQEHMNKYIKSKKLNEEKKEMIVEYNGLKEEKKMEQLKVLKLEREESRQRMEKEEAKRRLEKDQAEMKGKLGQWKERKAREKKEQEERRLKMQVRKKQEEVLRRQQAEERNKQLLQQWKQEEALKKQEHLRRVRSAKKPVQIDHEAEERIRARQQQMMMKKMELVSERRREEEMVRQKQSRIKEQKFVKYSHVTPKLDKKTTAMKEKERGKFDGKDKKEGSTFGGQLLMTGVRATPSWMK